MTGLRRPRSGEELDAIFAQDQARQTEMIGAVLRGEIVADGDPSLIISDWDADTAMQKAVDVAFEDVVEGIEQNG